MATKAKSATPSPAAAETLESRLDEAIQAYHAGKANAESLLKALEGDAMAAGKAPLARTCSSYLHALARKAEDPKELKVSPVAAATLLINRQQGAQALEGLDKALAKDAANATLLYLKALALVQAGKPDAAAEALKKAVAEQGSFVYQYQLEPDFNAVRHHPAFAEFELA